MLLTFWQDFVVSIGDVKCTVVIQKCDTLAVMYGCQSHFAFFLFSHLFVRCVRCDFLLVDVETVENNVIINAACI